MGLSDWLRARSRRSTPASALAELNNRVTGALLGVHAGDSLGATVEFMSPQRVRQAFPNGHRDIIGGGGFGWAAGAATDDTDLTKAVLDAYVTSAPDRDLVRRAADNMLAWRRKGPRDIGGTTRQALARYEQTGDLQSGPFDDHSAANGSLMRCIPTALVRRDEPDRRRSETRAISQITHGERRAVDACVAYNEMVAALASGATATEAVDRALQVCADEDLDPRVADAIRLGRRLDLAGSARQVRWVFDGEAPAAGAWHDGRGYVLDSLAVAVAAVEDDRSLDDVLVDVVGMGGDADTNGAIAGGALGARDGAAAIPERWTEQLQYKDEFETGAGQLTAPGWGSSETAGGLPHDTDLVQRHQALMNDAAAGSFPRREHDRRLRDGRIVPVRGTTVHRRG